jgi:integrase
MSKSLEERLHTNHDFQFGSFKGISRKVFNIYPDASELKRLYQQDLSESPDFDRARDAFLVLCETGLRISDYSKVDLHIRRGKDGIKLIQLTQGKTDGEVFIPVSARLDAILKKYKGTLPKIHDQYINRDIKKVAKMCKINDVLRWNEKKLGKTYEKTCKKWEKITCHTAN